MTTSQENDTSWLDVEIQAAIDDQRPNILCEQVMAEMDWLKPGAPPASN